MPVIWKEFQYKVSGVILFLVIQEILLPAEQKGDKYLGRGEGDSAGFHMEKMSQSWRASKNRKTARMYQPV